MADGAIEIDRVVEALPDRTPSVLAEADPFQSLAGFIVRTLDRFPVEGELVTVVAFSFEIVDMDRQRIDKVMIRPQPAEEASEAESEYLD